MIGVLGRAADLMLEFDIEEGSDMEQYCMALDYSDKMSFLWSPGQSNPALCGAPAHFMVRVNDPEIGGRLWLCAECYDVYCAWIGHEPCEF